MRKRIQPASGGTSVELSIVPTTGSESAAGAPTETAPQGATAEQIAAALYATRNAEFADQTPPALYLRPEELSDLHSSREFIQLLRSRNIDVGKIKTAIKYENELESLQIELVKLQRWIQENGKRLAIIFEGRDAAGKGGTIRRFIEHLNPRGHARRRAAQAHRGRARPVVLPALHEAAAQQGRDRLLRPKLVQPRQSSSRSTASARDEEYERFMQQVPEFEHMLVEDGVDPRQVLVLDLARGAARRASNRASNNPLKQWKLSPLDGQAQELWDAYTKYKELMFSRTHTSFSPWIIVKANNKKQRPAGEHPLRAVADRLRRQGQGPGIALPRSQHRHPLPPQRGQDRLRCSTGARHSPSRRLCCLFSPHRRSGI